MAPKPIEEDALKVGRQIYFTSRTHSQLSQVFSELRKTTFSNPSPSSSPSTTGLSSSIPGEDTLPQPAIRALALGSRKNLCINPSILKGGPSGLDERCLDLQSSSSLGCPFLPSREEGAFERGKGKEFGEKILSRVRDIEDLRELGEREGCCSYYASRSVIPQAEVRSSSSSPSYFLFLFFALADPGCFRSRLRVTADHRPPLQPPPPPICPRNPQNQPKGQRSSSRRSA